MTTTTDIVNLALQAMGSRTTVTPTEMTNQSTNEAIQATLILDKTRDRLSRMAPWDCCLNYLNLAYISSIPGTPENSSAATQLWQKGQPAPPWAYEYQYPNNCLRACWMIDSNQTGFTGIPITTAVTGFAAGYGRRSPIKFKVGIDQFFPVTAAAVAAGGTGYVVGDQITLASGVSTSAPIGAPVVLQVVTAPGGVIGTVSVVSQIMDETNIGGSYFAVQTNPVVQGSTTGVGTGATFNLTFGSQGDQRVILTDLEYATLAYVKRITDPNVMDPLFQNAWANVLGAGMCMGLTGDKNLANGLIALANGIIGEARKADGNEGLTINDVTPDWIRIRGIVEAGWDQGPNFGFDWGPMWGTF